MRSMPWLVLVAVVLYVGSFVVRRTTQRTDFSLPEKWVREIGNPILWKRRRAVAVVVLAVGLLFQLKRHGWLPLIVSAAIIVWAVMSCFWSVRRMRWMAKYLDRLDEKEFPSVPPNARPGTPVGYLTYIQALLGLFAAGFCAYVLSVATIYSAASEKVGGCFNLGFHHHIDALYFTLTTLTTVGFGDIHANAPTCQWLVSGQLLLDFTFVGLVIVAYGPARSALKTRDEFDPGGLE